MKKCVVRFIILCKESCKIEIRSGRRRCTAFAPAWRQLTQIVPFNRLITVSACSNNKKQTNIYRLTPALCQTVKVVFFTDIVATVPIQSIQTFTMYDKNYNLPISGTLVFIKQQ